MGEVRASVSAMTMVGDKVVLCILGSSVCIQMVRVSVRFLDEEREFRLLE